MTAQIGFKQGRLSPLVPASFQPFPWEHWRDEFPAAQQSGFPLIEWMLDHPRHAENPVMTPHGRAEISELCRAHGIRVRSLTGDLFMQAPFWQAEGGERSQRLRELDAVIEACGAAGITMIVLPLLDNGSLHSRVEEDVLVGELVAREPALRHHGIRILLESDYGPAELARLVARLPVTAFGINYDTGNSASLGWDCGEELAAYGDRIVSVHLKDRIKGGGTVPLGTGSADLPKVLGMLVKRGYTGGYILESARATDGDHRGVLTRYRDMCRRWIEAAS
jgi:hexulose-6-phosphate isomerase